MQISFVAEVDPGAEAALLTHYIDHPISVPQAVESADDSTITTGGAVAKADRETASTNLKGMFAKNVFYAFHLAKYIRMRSKGEVAVILNPLRLTHAADKGFKYQPFEPNMPPADVDIHFLSYVHPSTSPSNRGDVITTFGETIAPVVSIRVDRAFNPEVRGAVALTGLMAPTAHDPDDLGIRGQMIEYFNVKKYNKDNKFSLLKADEQEKYKSTGDFERGKYFRLPLGTFDLTRKGIPPELVSPQDVAASNYSPGNYHGYQLYDTYFRIAMSALREVNGTKVATAAQKKYWSFFEQADLTDVMLGDSDRRKRRFIDRARRTELKYLEDRDRNWIEAVLKSNDFSTNLNALRDAEQKAREEYVAAQTRAAVGMLLAIGGAVASSRSNSTYGQVGGMAMVGAGVALVIEAVANLQKVDASFNTSFSTAYDSQKTYVFEAAQGERVEVRAKDYADFKKQLKARYYERFRRDSILVPTS